RARVDPPAHRKRRRPRRARARGATPSPQHPRRLSPPPAQRTRDRSPLMSHHVPANLPELIRHYIDGAFADSVDGTTFDVLDPVSNETYVQAASGKQADIDLAVAAAKRAFDDGPWPRMKNRERARILNRIADQVEA